MYAIVKTGGKQYKVAEGDVIEVEKLVGAAGDAVAGRTREAVDRERVAHGHLVLAATGLHHCVHH